MFDGLDIRPNVAKLIQGGGRAVIAYSGGPDTIVLHKLLSDNGWELFPLLINIYFTPEYIDMISKNAEKCGIDNLLVFNFDMRKLGVTMEEKQEGFYNPKYVHFAVCLYNTHVLYALAKSASCIFNAAHSEDKRRATTEEQVNIDTYFRMFNRTVRIVSPFTKLTKSEVFKLGMGLGIDLAYSYSCVKCGPNHCGVCLQCLSRKEAFKKTGIEDKTVYDG